MAGYAFETAREHWKGYIYTDRPVYRPGHTVHFKGVIRQRGVAGYIVPARKALSVEIQDAEQKPVYQKTLTANANGTIRDDLELPAGAALGNYSIQVHAGEENFMSGSFEVEEYKKPEYEVRVTPRRRASCKGESAQAVIDSRYYFGEPVSGRQGEVRRLPRAATGSRCGTSPTRTTRRRRRRAATTTATSRSCEQRRPARCRRQAGHRLSPPRSPSTSTTTDIASKRASPMPRKREIAGRGGVIATYGSFVVNVAPRPLLLRSPAAAASFTVEARDYDCKPVRTRVHVELCSGTGGRRPSEPQTPRHGGRGRRRGRHGRRESTSRRRAARTACASARARPKAATSRSSRICGSPAAGEAISGPTAIAACRSSPTRRRYRAGETAKVLIVTGRRNTPVLRLASKGRDLRSSS